ncbi:serine hydrolase [Duganella sp. FT135W]|uniref:Serine hydrolase n=1 Tax=Duganella flavida TaxID=2692175 RepID=A0A6L8KDN3_9BURK|nr:serine hydrolase [Duganella flavida]MYM23894.1 serine hydrolase [Duganella flavida]
MRALGWNIALAVALAAAVGSIMPATAADKQPAAVSVAAASSELDAFIAKGMSDWRVPGLSIVVVNDKGVVYEKGFGVREIGKPGKVDMHTMFGMMSTTKAMTALALAMLVDEGKLAWDDPVIKYLPKLRLPNTYLTEHVTIRDTLRHSSGVQDADFLWAREDMDTQEVLRRLEYVPATAALRSDFVYNNVMYQVAGQVIEAVSGKRWEDFIATRIMAPIGMSESAPTMLKMLAAKRTNVSIPHAEIDGVVRTVPDSSVDIVPAAGAAWSNAHDAGKWLAFLLAGGKVNDKQLVSEANFKELFTPQLAVQQEQFGYPTTALTKPHFTAYGFGWFLQDYRGQFVAMHTGSMNGRTSIIGLLPDAKLGVYIFGNLDHAEFRHALMWKVLDVYSGAASRDWNGEALALYGGLKKEKHAKQDAEDAKRIAGTKHSHPLADYAGTYRHPAWGDAVVTLDGDSLVIRFGTAAEMTGRLEQWHYDTFRTRLGVGINGWDKFVFVTAVDGSIAALKYDEDTFTRVPGH